MINKYVDIPHYNPKRFGISMPRGGAKTSAPS